MAKFNERLKYLRQEAKLSQAEFAKQIGISKSSINMYERGEREPSIETMETIADYFNVDMDYLHGKSDHKNKTEWLNEINKSDYPSLLYGDDENNRNNQDLNRLNKYGIKKIIKKRFPLLGEIACGKPIFAEEDRELYVETGANIDADFCLIAKGDSMINARIFDGDIVFIKNQSCVNNGEIAAVIIEDEATLKRVYYYPENNKLILMPENSQYEPLVYMNEELEYIHIIGKAIAFMSRIK